MNKQKSILPAPSPQPQAPRPKSPAPYYFLLVFVSLFLIMDCVPQPRYRSESFEKKKSRIVSEEEAPINEQVESGRQKSTIDQAKMGKIIDSFLGVPYKLGGENKSGMDCSGLAVAVYLQYAGFKLPHDTKKLFKLVKRVDKENLAYGDLVFFSDGWFGVSHVGIYIGESKFVHSMEDFGVVASSLDEDYYKKRYIGARRVIP